MTPDAIPITTPCESCGEEHEDCGAPRCVVCTLQEEGESCSE